ncbi:MAG TPA: hypothetical protein ENJ09_13705 [Planctomycetes bacterium]|nr:hypothetical protein [Planctomycetota bacterium]
MDARGRAGGCGTAGPAWDALHRGLAVAVLGAGRAIGREVLSELLRAGHPPGLLSLHGRRPTGFAWRGTPLRVAPLESIPTGIQLAFLCTRHEVAGALFRSLVDREIRVVDLAGVSAGGGDAAVSLDGIGEGEMGLFTQAVAMPAPALQGLLRVLRPIETAARLVTVEVTSLLGAAHGGAGGMRALREQVRGLAEAGIHAADPEGRIGNPVGLTPEEAWGPGEGAEDGLRRFLGRPELPVQVEPLAGDNERVDLHLVRVDLAEELTPEAARALLAGAPGVRVEAEARGPIPVAVRGSRRVHVGRIRTGSRGSRSLCFSAVADPLRLGAQAAVAAAGRLSAVS